MSASLLFNGPNLLWNGDSLNQKLLYGIPCVEPANAMACVRSDAVTRIVCSGTAQATARTPAGAGGPFRGGAAMTFNLDLLINAQANSTLLAPNGPTDCRFMWTHFFPGLLISDNVVSQGASNITIDNQGGPGANASGSGVMVRYRHRCGNYFQEFVGQTNPPTQVYEFIELIVWFDMNNSSFEISQGGPATLPITYSIRAMLSQGPIPILNANFVGVGIGFSSIGAQAVPFPNGGGFSAGTTPGVGPFVNSTFVSTNTTDPNLPPSSGSFTNMTCHVDNMVTCADALCAFTQTPAQPAGMAPPPPLDDPTVVGSV